MFESIQIPQLHNPVAEGVGNIGNIIVAARQRHREEEMKRARFLLDQQNIQSDNARADAQMGLQQAQFKRTGENQAEERRRTAANDFNQLWEMSGKDPARAMAHARALGYRIDVSDPHSPKLVPAAPGPASQEQEKVTLLPLHDASDEPARPAGSAVGPGAGAPARSVFTQPLAPPAPDGPPAPGPDAGPGVADVAAQIGAVGAPPSPAPASAPAQAPAPAPGPAAPPAPAAAPPDLHGQIMQQFDQAAAMPQIEPAAMPTVGSQLQTASLPGRFTISGGYGQLPATEIDPAAARRAQDEEDAKALKLRTAAPEVRAAVQREIETQKQADRLAKIAHDDEERAKYHETAATQEQLTRDRTAAIAARANATQAEALDSDVIKTIAGFQGVVKEVNASAQSKDDVFVSKLLPKVQHELSGGGAGQAGAIDTLGRIYQGGKATNVVIGLLKEPMGMLTSVKDKLYQTAHNGQHMPEVVEAFRRAARDIEVATQENAARDWIAAATKYGPSTIWDNPATGAMARQQLRTLAVELNINPARLRKLEAQVAGQAPEPTDEAPPAFQPGAAVTRRSRRSVSGPAARAPAAGPAARGGSKEESDADFLKRMGVL